MMQKEAQRVVRQLLADISRLPDRGAKSMRSVRRKHSALLRKAEPATLIAIAQLLVDRNEHRWVGYELILRHPNARTSITEREVVRLGQGIGHWGDADAYGGFAGYMWRTGRVSDSRVLKWARSGNRWSRRISLVCTVPLNVRAQGGTGDTLRTLRLCRMLVEDRDDMVVKALSWALRALVVHDRGAVTAFLQRHEDRLAKRVLREVRNKLRTGVKNPRKQCGAGTT
jgi:hypothetical protein